MPVNYLLDFAQLFDPSKYVKKKGLVTKMFCLSVRRTTQRSEEIDKLVLLILLLIPLQTERTCLN